MTGIADRIMKRTLEHKAGWVCTPKDFDDLGSPAAVNQALSRLTKAGRLRRIGQGLYDVPRTTKTLKWLISADISAAVAAIARRNNAKILPDGLKSANLLGLTNAVGAKAVYDTDGPSRTLTVDGRNIRFRHAPPSVMRWAGKPGAPVVQALRWLGPYAGTDPDVVPILRRCLPDHVKTDLSRNSQCLPVWMRSIVNRATREIES